MPPRQPWLLKIPPTVSGGGFVESFTLLREQITDWNIYPFNIPALQNLEQIELHPAVTFLVGENGSGKSTLLEAMAVKLGFSAEGGSKNFNFSTKDTHSSLNEHLRYSRPPGREQDHFFLRAETFYPLMTQVDEYGVAWGGKSPHERSHGEAFMSLLTERLEGGGLYLFDEPEAALSPKRQMAALVRIHDLVMLESQFIIATHSPILLSYPHATIYEFSESGIRKVTYEETEVFRTTRDFILRHEKMVAMLLDESEAEGTP